ncbi:MAG: transcriptional regulator [Planctomycetota bacterium]|nr:MAG: transcriptional regulator [Planctomycetota bacterium]
MKKLILQDPEQWAVLISPVRLEIVSFLEETGTSSIAEIAKGLGRTPDSLYFHVRKLTEAGILLRADGETTKARREALFSLPADQVRIPFRVDSKENVLALTKVTAALLRQADREFRHALERQEPPKVDGESRMHSHRLRAWMTSEDLKELNGYLNQIHRLLTQANRRKQGRPYAFSTVLAPLNPLPETGRQGKKAKPST